MSMSKSSLSVRLRKPHSAQQQILSEARRFNVLDCGRRFGKTEFGIHQAITMALRGYPVAWYAPVYRDAMDVWRALKLTLRGITKTKNETEKRIELITGGTIEVWTLNDPDNSRGRKYKRVIIDEAAKIPHLSVAWNETIRATLTDYKGDAWFLSTPKGRNFFWQLYQRGLDSARYPEWQSWHRPTTDNPFIDPDEVEAARHEMPERAFQQEYLAEFLDDGGAVFRNLRACTTSEYSEPSPEYRYVFGVDWGKSHDFTVIVVMDHSGRMVTMERFNQIGWSLQRGRLLALADKWQPDAIWAELNSIGDPNVEALQDEGLPVYGFQTTAQSKTPLIDSLALAFERAEIGIIDEPVLLSELQSYSMERLLSGRFRYSAPEGMHDDTVIALALAWHGVQTGVYTPGTINYAPQLSIGW
jgi:hypothetical protein